MMPKVQDSKYPTCFGNLKKVFPMGEDGLRHTPAQCLACAHKTECLRKAIEGADGREVQEEQIDRAYQSGMIGFWQRWSKRKNLFRRKKSAFKA